MTSPSPPPLLRAARQWWSDLALREGRMAASSRLLAEVWEFLRDSTPARRRQRYGDADYDWDHHVNTTSAAVSWRDRLLGVFHSPYQPTEPALFHEMLEALRQQVHLDFRDFTFIDLGSGKGRTLLLASDYPFRRIAAWSCCPLCIRSHRKICRSTKANRKSVLRWNPSVRTQPPSLFPPSPRCCISSILSLSPA